MINKTFYKDSDKPFQSFGNNDTTKENREFNVSASIINVARDLYGEQIKPKSIDLSLTTDGKTYNIVDDGDGNLYDNILRLEIQVSYLTEYKVNVALQEVVVQKWVMFFIHKD